MSSPQLKFIKWVVWLVSLLGNSLCLAQNLVSEADVLKMRQALCDEFSQAMAKAEIDTLVAHYSSDVVWAVIAPDLVPPLVGRDAIRKNYEQTVKRVTGYVSKVERGQLRSDGTVWTQGVYTLFVKGPDGNPVQRWGRWMDLLRRKGDRWEVFYQVNAAIPARPNPDPTSN